MTIFQIPGLILWLVVVPFCMGLLFMPLFAEHLRRPGAAFVSGYILFFTLLELVGIPVVLFHIYHGLTIFIRWFVPVVSVLSIAGVGVALWEKKNGRGLSFEGARRLVESSTEEKIVMVLFFILIGFQLYMSFTRASFDGDDAYYGVQALIAQQVDTLYRVNPYTGRSAPLDVRHALALFPVWEAFLGRMCGIHATIISHSVVPLILIPLTYVLYFQIGKALFGGKKGQLPMFMVLIALWQIFGNISIYTTETFFLTRTWQGKSFAGNFVIPAVLWIFLSLFTSYKKVDEDVLYAPKGMKNLGRWAERPQPENAHMGKKGLWLLLACLNLAGGASSSLAILLSCMMTMGFGFLFAVRERKFGIFIKAGFTCVPGGVYVLLYLALTHGIFVP